MFFNKPKCKVEFEVKIDAVEGLPDKLRNKPFFITLKRGHEYSAHTPSMVMKDPNMVIGHSFKFTSHFTYEEKSKEKLAYKELEFKIVTKKYTQSVVAKATFDLSKLVVQGVVEQEGIVRHLTCCRKDKKDTCLSLTVTFRTKVLKINGKVLKKVVVTREPGVAKDDTGDLPAVDPYAELPEFGAPASGRAQMVRLNNEDYLLETDLEASEQVLESTGASLSESEVYMNDSESEMSHAADREGGKSNLDESSEKKESGHHRSRSSKKGLSKHVGREGGHHHGSRKPHGKKHHEWLSSGDDDSRVETVRSDEKCASSSFQDEKGDDSLSHAEDSDEFRTVQSYSSLQRDESDNTVTVEGSSRSKSQTSPESNRFRKKDRLTLDDDDAASSSEGKRPAPMDRGGKNMSRSALHISDDAVGQVRSSNKLMMMTGERSDHEFRKFSHNSLNAASSDRSLPVPGGSLGDQVVPGSEAAALQEEGRKKKKGTLRKFGIHLWPKDKPKRRKSADRVSETTSSYDLVRDGGQEKKPIESESFANVASSSFSSRGRLPAARSENGSLLSSDYSFDHRTEPRSSKEDEKTRSLNRSFGDDKSGSSLPKPSKRTWVSKLKGDRGGGRVDMKRVLEEELESLRKENQILKQQLKIVKSKKLMSDIVSAGRRTGDSVESRLSRKLSSGDTGMPRIRPMLVRSASFRDLDSWVESKHQREKELSTLEKLSFYKSDDDDDDEDLPADAWDHKKVEEVDPSLVVTTDQPYDSPASSHRMIHRLSDVRAQLTIYEQLALQSDRIESLLYNSEWTYTESGRSASAEKFADYILSLKVIGSRNQYNRQSRKLFNRIISALYGQSIRHADNLDVLLGTFHWIVTLLCCLVEKADTLEHPPFNSGITWVRDVDQHGLCLRYASIDEVNQEIGNWDVSKSFDQLIEDLTPSEAFLSMSDQLCCYLYARIFSVLISLVPSDLCLRAFLSPSEQVYSVINRSERHSGRKSSVVVPPPSEPFRDTSSLTVHSIALALTPFFDGIKKHRVPDGLKFQLLGQVFYFVNAEVVNAIIRRSDYCSTKIGISVKMSASYFKQWISEQRYGVPWSLHLEKQFGAVLDVANVLTIDKKFFTGNAIDEFRDVFPTLNLMQICRLLSQFHADDTSSSTELISPKVLSVLSAAVENADKKCGVYLDSTALRVLEEEEEMVESDLFER